MQPIQPQGKAKVSLTFGLYQGGQLVHRETVAQDIVKVGKDPKSHLRIDDEYASRMHAVIEVASPEDITLIDLGNEPGTLVNGARINKCKIHPGDQIQIGTTIAVLEHAEAVAVAMPPPMPPQVGGTMLGLQPTGGQGHMQARGYEMSAPPAPQVAQQMSPAGYAPPAPTGYAPPPAPAGYAQAPAGYAQAPAGYAPPPPMAPAFGGGFGGGVPGNPFGGGVSDDAPEGSYTYQ